MNFDLTISVSAFTVFIQGLLSFFSPCVFPLIPLYISYLSGGSVSKDAQGQSRYSQKKVFLHTLFFILGISFAFLTLGLGATAFGTFLENHRLLIARIGGVLIFLFGLYQLGVFGDVAFLNQEHRLPFRLDRLTMSPLTAFLMGFTFSFAWTPCVGPALTGVLLMTASSSSRAAGLLLIGLYTLGFVLPFLLVGIFTTKLLNLFRKRKQVIKYTMKIGGILMVIMGVMMFTGQMNEMTGYLSGISGFGSNTAVQNEAEGDAGEAVSETETKIPEIIEETDKQTEAAADHEEQPAEEAATEEAITEEATEEAVTEEAATEEATAEEATAEEAAGSGRSTVPAPDFSLSDQYGQTHTLAQYRGKVIFLNFWATWCPPCRNEMPDIQKLYERYQEQEYTEVVILGVAASEYGQEGTVEEITAFLEENGYSYPVVMDTEHALFDGYGIPAIPTTFMIDKEGKVFGYITGQLTEEMMENIIQQTLDAGKLTEVAG